ncbi:MAG: hypothetical protein WHV28_05880 [Bacteroidota bacterium]
MDNKYQYRLTEVQKKQIAQNLIDVFEKDATIIAQTRRFIGDWILTGSNEKRKAFFDVWEIVLKNFLPKTRPILFRSCDRISKNGKIVSFTGRIECARRFSNNKGFLIICDTKETLSFEDTLYNQGDYRHTFYPLAEVLIRAKEAGGWGFSERLLNNYIGEDEYIMKINLDHMHITKWIKTCE